MGLIYAIDGDIGELIEPNDIDVAAEASNPGPKENAEVLGTTEDEQAERTAGRPNDGVGSAKFPQGVEALAGAEGAEE